MPTKKSPSAQRVIDAFKERERRRDPLGVTRQSDIKELEAILRQQESGGYSRTYRK